MIDSLGDSKFPAGDPREHKTGRSGAQNDFFERTYPVLWVLARHGVDKNSACAAMWRNLSVRDKTLRLMDGSYVVLDDQDVADLIRVKNRYPNPRGMTKQIVGSSVWTYHINPRVMERWACRADLRRDPVRYEDLVLGFAALDVSKFRRILPEPPRSS